MLVHYFVSIRVRLLGHETLDLFRSDLPGISVYLLNRNPSHYGGRMVQGAKRSTELCYNFPEFKNIFSRL